MIINEENKFLPRSGKHEEFLYKVRENLISSPMLENVMLGFPVV